MNYETNQSVVKSLRETWDFKYLVSDVIKSAKKQAQYRMDRIKWWESEADQAEAKLKEKGFEYRERQFTGGSDINIVGDPELARRVTTCKSKIKEHQEMVGEYSIWITALENMEKRDAEAELTLKFDDIVFFGL